MLRAGPIPPFAHGLVGYAFALALIAAPFLLELEARAATACVIVLGVATLALEAASDLPTGLAKVIPPSVHAALDFAISGALIASPFLFGFSDEGTPTAFFIAAGVVALLVTLATRWLPERTNAAAT